jgi:hypothetical protein
MLLINANVFSPLAYPLTVTPILHDLCTHYSADPANAFFKVPITTLLVRATIGLGFKSRQLWADFGLNGVSPPSI